MTLERNASERNPTTAHAASTAADVLAPSAGQLLHRPAGAGEINVPRGTLHRFPNAGAASARLILTFSPAGIEEFFEETLERVEDPSRPPADNVEDVAARYGIDFVTA